jgi:nitric oxide reductase subunit B
LALALMLFSLREIVPERIWNEKLLRFSFWAINGGLALMLVLGLIPNGFYQLVASVNHGTWYARSADFISSPWMQGTVWSRLPGDLLFALGALAMVIFTAQAIIAIFRRGVSATPLLSLSDHEVRP